LISRKLTEADLPCQPLIDWSTIPEGRPMSLLKSEPSAPVRTLDELFAIAHAMENEAAARYAEIAERMRAEGNPDLAGVFEKLSVDEKGHLDGVMRWSESQRGRAPDPSLIRWKAPETFDDEGIATADPRLLSVYRALATAVRNEERAFAFWTYVAAQAGTPEIRQAAEAMALEELGHVSTLRRERRRAFHAERAARGGSSGHDGAGEAARLERRLAEQLESLADKAPLAEGLRLRDFAQEARGHAEELEEAIRTLPATQHAYGAPDDPVALAEWLTDRYLDAADHLEDEDALGRVQVMAGHAIARLAWLRSDLPELEAG
jgi:rubrerythrin